MQDLLNYLSDPVGTFLSLSLNLKFAVSFLAFLIVLTILASLKRAFLSGNKTGSETPGLQTPISQERRRAAPLTRNEPAKKSASLDEEAPLPPPSAPAPETDFMLKESPSQEIEEGLDGLSDDIAEIEAEPEALPETTPEAKPESLAEALAAGAPPTHREAPIKPATPPAPQELPGQQDPLDETHPLAARIGRLVENIPRNMRVNIPVRVEARISDNPQSDMTGSLKGTPTEHKIQTTPAMTVLLRAPEGGFIIEPLSLETQWINNQRAESFGFVGQPDFGEWQWRVTPLERGQKPLKLYIAAHVAAAGHQGASITLPQQEIEITVKVNVAAVMRKAALWTALAVLGGLIAKFGENALDLALTNLS